MGAPHRLASRAARGPRYVGAATSHAAYMNRGAVLLALVTTSAALRSLRTVAPGRRSAAGHTAQMRPRGFVSCGTTQVPSFVKVLAPSFPSAPRPLGHRLSMRAAPVGEAGSTCKLRACDEEVAKCQPVGLSSVGFDTSGFGEAATAFQVGATARATPEAASR